VRPRQARYQAALRPDNNCFIHSKALSNFTATPIHRFWLDCAEMSQMFFEVPNKLRFEAGDFVSLRVDSDGAGELENPAKPH